MMLSSANLSADAAYCRSLGIDAYLVKPVSHSDLRQTLQSVLVSPILPNRAIPIQQTNAVRDRGVVSSWSRTTQSIARSPYDYWRSRGIPSK
jgi:hypothetical protein